MRAAQLGNRVVAVAEEDPLVELAGALALLAVEGRMDAALAGELVQVEAPQRGNEEVVPGDRGQYGDLGVTQYALTAPLVPTLVSDERGLVPRPPE